jgi:hypothetical protein
MPTTNDTPGQPLREDRPTGDDGSGVRSTLKILVPLGLLVVVVFGITFLFLYTPTDTPDPEINPGLNPSGERPLRFFTSARQFDPRPVWDPTNLPQVSLQDHYFPGYFEKNAEARTAFWFENRNPKPVSMQLKNVSCAACSGGSLAPIPAESARDLLQMFAVTGLPQGLVSPLPIGVAGTWADTVPRLQWQSHKFATNDWTFTVPAADPSNPWAPTQWGILDLNFGTGGKTQLDATFGSQVHESKQYAEDKLNINFQVVNAFDVIPYAIDVGGLKATDDSPSQTKEFFVYSATRGPGTAVGDLPPPACTIRMPGGAGESGKLITVETPVPLSPAECERLAERVAPPSAGGRMRVTAAYRVTVRITPKAGDDRLDIGLLDREIWVTVAVSGTNERQVRLKGTVSGDVWLSDAKEVAVGSFKGEEGGSGSVRIVTERPGVELAVVPGESRPDFLDVSLQKLPDDPDRGYYQLTVRVPPKRQFGTIQNGLVVLEIKGPKPQRIRIPVTGKGGF